MKKLKLLSVGKSKSAKENERLADALEHIARVAARGRTQSRRDLWIECRALSALNGDDDYKHMDLPPNGYSRAKRMWYRMREAETIAARLAEVMAAMDHESARLMVEQYNEYIERVAPAEVEDA